MNWNRIKDERILTSYIKDESDTDVKSSPEKGKGNNRKYML